MDLRRQINDKAFEIACAIDELRDLTESINEYTEYHYRLFEASEMIKPDWVNKPYFVRFSTYAKINDKSLSWVVKLAKEGKITEVIIDGVHFIKIKEDGYKKV